MRLSLRVKLALLSLLLLLFPLLGMRLNTILKNNLMTSQEETLNLTAQAAAAVLENRNDLFAREQFHSLNQDRDLYIFQLSNVIQLDGSIEDWQPELDQAELFGAEHLLSPAEDYTPETLSFRHLTGKQEKYLYVLFDVTDDHVVYRSKKSLRLDRSDYIRIIIEDGPQRRNYILAAHGPGWINGFRMPDNPKKFPVPEKRIQGVWRQTARGYIVEMRIPLSMSGRKLAFTVADVDDPNKRTVHALIGTASVDKNTEPGWLLGTSTAIEHILKSLDLPYTRIRVVDRNQRIRAQVGSLQDSRPETTLPRGYAGRMLTGLHDLLQPLYRFFTTSFSTTLQDPASQPTELDQQGIREGLAGKKSITRYLAADGQVEIMAAITPLKEKDTVIGAILVEQTTNSILALSNKMIEETISLSVLAFLTGGGLLLLFAFHISARIRRLRNQAAAAITEDGRIHCTMKQSRARDEIGDLSRTLQSMLLQLQQQVEHREKMADNLEHEMRTPLAGVAASLKNLAGELDNSPERIKAYLNWAERDIQRMEGLLTAIREATTLEQALQQETMETFSLGRALSMWLEHGWQQTYAEVEFLYSPPDREIMVPGDPHRLRQALDNIVENAVSFHDSGTPVELLLQQKGSAAIIQVINQGPVIAPSLQGQIFNSMVTNRPNRDSGPHLGLGLFIARTILQHHNGTLGVKNLDDGRQGVVFTLSLPVQS